MEHAGLDQLARRSRDIGPLAAGQIGIGIMTDHAVGHVDDASALGRRDLLALTRCGGDQRESSQHRYGPISHRAQATKACSRSRTGPWADSMRTAATNVELIPVVQRGDPQDPSRLVFPPT